MNDVEPSHADCVAINIDDARGLGGGSRVDEMGLLD